MNFIPYLAGWERASNFLKVEAAQLIEEGREPRWIEKLMAKVDLPQADEATLAELWTRLQEAPARADFNFVEPNGLAEIRAERTPAARQFSLHLSEKELSPSHARRVARSLLRLRAGQTGRGLHDAT